MERSNRNKKSSKKPLILGVSALVLIAAAGGGYYAYSQWQKSDPENLSAIHDNVNYSQ